MIVDLGRGTVSTGFRFSGFESVIVDLGAGDDVIYGAAGIWAAVYAGEGDNVAIGSDGDELFQGRSGDDVMLGKGGNDTLVGNGGDDVLDGGAGDDLVWLYKPEGVVRGGDGQDLLHIQAEAVLESLEFDALAGSMNTGLVFSGFESYRVQTNIYNENDDTDDTLRGGHGNDVFHSSLGEDLIDGRGGDDEIWGGADADVLIGGAGADTFYWDGDAAPGNGVDRVVDFDPDGGDVLRFGTNAKHRMGIDDFDDFLGLARDTEAGVFVPFGQGRSDGILLEGVKLADLGADDILFY
jgi:Ca2+-binding RTX toxin-like protein